MSAQTNGYWREPTYGGGGANLATRNWTYSCTDLGKKSVPITAHNRRKDAIPGARSPLVSCHTSCTYASRVRRRGLEAVHVWEHVPVHASQVHGGVTMSQGPNPETVRQYTDATTEGDQAADGLTPSSAPNTSFDTGAGDGTAGFDSPLDESRWLSNPDVGGPATPYYPPDGPSDGTSTKPIDHTREV